MKVYISIIIVFVFFNVGYCQDFQYYPFLKANSNKVKPPISIEDALKQLDFVLKKEIIEYFKNVNESLATLRICQELGDFFIIRWKLSINTGLNNKNIIPDYFSKLQEDFYNLNVNNPILMMRVVFRCYHKKLNNLDYSLNYEIDKIKKDFSSSEYYVATTEQYWTALSKIQSCEDSVLFKDKLNSYSKNDTLGLRYYEEKRESTFYITGIIDTIDVTNQLISLKIIDIVSNKRYRSVFYNNELIKIYDKINIYSQNWYKYNESYFNYHYGKFDIYLQEWNDYVKFKYNSNETCK